jgi:hypothetical protein
LSSDLPSFGSRVPEVLEVLKVLGSKGSWFKVPTFEAAESMNPEPLEPLEP